MSDQDVRAVIDAYAEGTRTRDIAKLKGCFAEGAKMTGWLGPDLLQGGPEPFYGALEANEVGDDYTSEITALTVEGPIAWTETRERNLLGLNFVNRFHLVRDGEGRWAIVSKLFAHG